MSKRADGVDVPSATAIDPRIRDALLHAETWIGSAPHGDNCYVSDHYEGDPGNRCNCGKESALSSIEQALEVIAADDVPAAERSADSMGKLISALRFVVRCHDSLTPSDIQRMQAILAEVGDKQC